jgi:mono/diheme cytochrome c family protein
MVKRLPLISLSALATLGVACNESVTMAVTDPNDGKVVQKAVTGEVKLGGKPVSLEQLQHGKEAFVRNCSACHGLKGDGKGVSSAGLRPAPRDFTLGTFKFAAVASGSLPNDADLLRIVRGGLHGTAMLEWQVPDAELVDIIQYIKTLSPRWQDETPGDPIVQGADPYGEANKAKAVERGRKIFHVTARCASCHPNYVTRKDLVEMTKEMSGQDIQEFRPDMYDPVLKDSDYGYKLLPPDFLRSEVRSGTTLNDLYRTVASGVGGTAMPMWKGALDADPVKAEADLWALVYYVDSLVEMKGTPAGRALRQQLLSQPPPPAPAPEPAPAPDAPKP